MDFRFLARNWQECLKAKLRANLEARPNQEWALRGSGTRRRQTNENFCAVVASGNFGHACSTAQLLSCPAPDMKNNKTGARQVAAEDQCNAILMQASNGLGDTGTMQLNKILVNSNATR